MIQCSVVIKKFVAIVIPHREVTLCVVEQHLWYTRIQITHVLGSLYHDSSEWKTTTSPWNIVDVVKVYYGSQRARTKLLDQCHIFFINHNRAWSQKPTDRVHHSQCRTTVQHIRNGDKNFQYTTIQRQNTYSVVQSLQYLHSWHGVNAMLVTLRQENSELSLESRDTDWVDWVTNKQEAHMNITISLDVSKTQTELLQCHTKP